MLSLGLLLAAIGGEFVAFRRYMSTPLPKLFWWVHTALLGWLILWSQWRQWRRAIREDGPGSPRVSWDRQKVRELVLAMAFALSFSGLYGLRELVWAAPTLALTGLVFCWLAGRFATRTYRLAMAGWLVAAAVSWLLPWPNEQRLGAIEFLGGLAMVLQGAWCMIRRSVTRSYA
jgi:hypothetical protein